MPEALAAIAPHAALALLTNKPEQLSRRLLEAFHLAPFFFMLIGGDSGFPRKPDPAGLLALVDAAGAAPRSTLLVGDSTIDQQTAGAGGVNFCLAGYGFGRLREAISLGKDDLLAEESGHLAAVVLGFLSRLETSGS
jgi:phosphoglycolate phosphatase